MGAINRRSLFVASAGALVLAAPAIAAGGPQGRSLETQKRVLPVETDNMMPSMQPGTDQMVIQPVLGWVGPGCYLIDNGGQETPYRCERHLGCTDIRLTSDNPAYPPHRIGQAQFDAVQRGRVVMLARHFL